MVTEPQVMPGRVLAAAIPVMVYTFACLTCGVFLISGLVMSKERFSFVLLIAISTTLSSVVGIAQECNNIANWHDLRVIQFKASVAAHESPSLALGPLSYGLSAALFWVQSYLYSVNGLLVLFWAIALVTSVWNWRFGRLQPHMAWISNGSKLLAIFLPAVLAVVRLYLHAQRNFVETLVLYNLLLLITLPVSTVCIILILVKYLITRFGLGGSLTGSLPSNTVSTGSRTAWSRLTGRVDPWLVFRFSIAWTLISGFEAVLIFFNVYRYEKVRDSIGDTSPDFSASTSIGDFLNYIPAPTCTLLAFLIFGTTAQLRARYADILRPVFCLCRRKRPTSPRIDRSSAQEWSRMTSQELSEQPRYRIQNGRLETIELDDRKDSKTDTEAISNYDIESLPERSEEKEGKYHLRRRSLI